MFYLCVLKKIVTKSETRTRTLHKPYRGCASSTSRRAVNILPTSKSSHCRRRRRVGVPFYCYFKSTGASGVRIPRVYVLSFLYFRVEERSANTHKVRVAYPPRYYRVRVREHNRERENV